MKRAIVLPVVFSFLAMTGCATTTKEQAARAADDKPYRFESEGQVPPPKSTAIAREVDRVDVFEETPVEEGVFVMEGVETVEEIPVVEEVPDSMQTGPGYRVQVFASGDPDAARTFEMEVEIRMGVATYLEHLDGMYKIRVGDCRNRDQAEELRDRCRRAGYTDAWIVSTEVRWLRNSAGETAKPAE